MEKNVNSAIATLVSVLLLFVYLLPYYVPYSLAVAPSNSSMIINGSITDMSGPNAMLFIINRNDPNPDHFSVFPVSPSFFSIELPMEGGPHGASFINGSPIGFKINGKDMGHTEYFISNYTLTGVKLTSMPPATQPGSGYIANSPATPVPFKINASVTPTVTPTASVTPLPITVTPVPITNTPTVSAASPSPASAFPMNIVIYAILIGIVLLAILIVYLRKK